MTASCLSNSRTRRLIDRGGCIDAGLSSLGDMSVRWSEAALFSESSAVRLFASVSVRWKIRTKQRDANHGVTAIQSPGPPSDRSAGYVAYRNPSVFASPPGQ